MESDNDAISSGDSCPTCTQSAKVNTANHLHCIKVAALGPADPRNPENAFWQAKMKTWGVPEGEARSRLCMNCEHYIADASMVDCVTNGAKIKASQLPLSPKWADIEGMPQGGPITDKRCNGDSAEGVQPN